MNTYETLFDKLSNDYNVAKAELALFNTVREAVAKFDGKQRTRRIHAAVAAALPGVTVYDGNAHEISIWGSAIPGHADHSRRIVLRLPMDGNGNFSLADFDDVNRWCGGEPAKARIAQLGALLGGSGRLGDLARRVDEILEATRELHAAIEGTPWEYPIRRLLKGEPVEGNY